MLQCGSAPVGGGGTAEGREAFLEGGAPAVDRFAVGREGGAGGRELSRDGGAVEVGAEAERRRGRARGGGRGRSGCARGGARRAPGRVRRDRGAGGSARPARAGAPGRRRARAAPRPGARRAWRAGPCAAAAAPPRTGSGAVGSVGADRARWDRHGGIGRGRPRAGAAPPPARRRRPASGRAPAWAGSGAGDQVSRRRRIWSSVRPVPGTPRTNQRVWQAVHCTWRPADGIMPSETSYSAPQFGQVRRIATSVGCRPERPNRVPPFLAAASRHSKPRPPLRRPARSV